MCIERQLITAIKSSNRQKHMPLNSYLSLNMSAYDNEEENENCYNILQLYLNALYTISETDKDIDLVVSIFKLRILCILDVYKRQLYLLSYGSKINQSNYTIREYKSK